MEFSPHRILLLWAEKPARLPGIGSWLICARAESLLDPAQIATVNKTAMT